MVVFPPKYDHGRRRLPARALGGRGQHAPAALRRPDARGGRALVAAQGLLRLRVRAVHGQGHGQVRAIHAAQGGHDARLRRGQGRPGVRRTATAAQVGHSGEAAELQGGQPQACAAGHGCGQEAAGGGPTG
ncbi:hypothetical protein ON010_g10915 [Phytophthora cinnamomi]|nr:hypothetical protein ON010_g10915 [Phytophthora cinnamomi]